MWSMFMPFIIKMNETDYIIYLSLSGFIGLASFGIACMPKFHSNEYHLMRVATFGMNGVLGLAGLLQMFIMYPQYQIPCIMGISAILSHTTGAIFYAFKFPECRSKHIIFQYVQGHTFFHVFVLIGFLIYYEACLYIKQT